MTSLSRATLRAAAVASVAALALAGCGSSDDPTAGPASPTVSVPSPTVTFTDGPSEDPSSDASDDASSDPSDDPSSTASSSADAEVVKVRKFGISFELPKGWVTLDAKKVLKGGGRNPFLDEMARRFGVSPEQLIQSFSTAVQTFSVSGDGAQHGFLSNVNSVGEEGDLNDDQLKLQLVAVGAKPGAVDHASTDAGDVTRMPYDLTSKSGLTVRGVAVAVHTDAATVVITISAATAAESARLADQVQASLAKLPGGAPGV
jgi:hypothetical protein